MSALFFVSYIYVCTKRRTYSIKNSVSLKNIFLYKGKNTIPILTYESHNQKLCLLISVFLQIIPPILTINIIHMAICIYLILTPPFYIFPILLSIFLCFGWQLLFFTNSHIITTIPTPADIETHTTNNTNNSSGVN